MARPRKVPNEVLIEIVDSYYLTRCDGNEKLMKCSLIAAYATELGYSVEGYDFARNLEVREHIERMKCFAETCNEVYGTKYQPLPSYKTLDVEDFLYFNRGEARLANALRELDAYWKRMFEFSLQAEKQNRSLMKEKAMCEMEFKNLNGELNKSVSENAEMSAKNNKLIAENRYLRKMLRTYLYPAVADEILKSENEPPQTDTEITDAAECDFIENGLPLSFEASVSKDDSMQAETERLIERLWEKCDG
jgi:hypothetical protein